MPTNALNPAVHVVDIKHLTEAGRMRQSAMFQFVTKSHSPGVSSVHIGLRAGTALTISDESATLDHDGATGTHNPQRRERLRNDRSGDTMSGRTLLVVTSFFLVLAAVCPRASGEAVERLTIEATADPAYLRYQFDSLASKQEPEGLRFLTDILHVVAPMSPDRQSALLVRCLNFGRPYENEHRASYMAYQSPAIAMLAEIPLRFTIHAWRSFFFPDSAAHGVLIVGAHQDSIYAFLVKRTDDDITTDQILLAVDHRPPPLDKIRLTVWVTGLRVNSNHQPPIAYIFSDQRPNRLLYCVRLDTLGVGWQRSVASPVQPVVATLRDSLGRTVTAFCTGNPANGLTDDEFDDRYAYLFMVDDSGGLVHKSLLACNWEQRGAMCPTQTDSELYVVHSLDFAKTVDSATLQVRDLKLTRINADGAVLRTTSLPSVPEWVRVVPYGPDRSLHVFVRTTHRELAIYDTSLTLTALAENTDIGVYRGELKIDGVPDPVYVFSDGLYDRHFTKLLTFPIDAHSAGPVVIDSSGNALELAVTGPNTYYIGAVRRKTAFDLASVFYHRNQNYVLSVFGVLLLALLFMTWYRWRTKRELEMFRLRQEMVIAEEKYAQARNIAGGFAHEIRNALFPADGVLTKLARTGDLPSLGHDRLAGSHLTARDAIARAIEITQLISTYTKLDSERSIESVDLRRLVDEVLTAHRDRIAGDGIDVKVLVPSGCRIAISHTHLRMVLVNLLLNSLDALAGRSTAWITIEAITDKETVRIEFADNGPGIPEDTRPRIFDAFFSTKPSSGTGLGLSVVKRIIQMYEGNIDVTKPNDTGVMFTITLDAYTERSGRTER